MKPAEIAKPLGVFVLVVVVVLAGTAVAAVALGSDPAPPPADGQNVSGQSPGQFQPDAVNPAVDPETGNVTVDAGEETKRILVDTRHSNQFSQDDFEPVVEALARAGHRVDFGARLGGTGGDFGDGGGYNATLQQYDALLVIFPTEGFTEGQRTAIQKYTDGGGRVLVLAEPTQVRVSGGFVASATQVSFGANRLTSSYGVRIGADTLYNMNDEATDNNFRSVVAEPTGDGPLTDGVDTVSFDRAGYAVPVGGTDADVLFTAADGAQAFDTGRTGSYPVVVRNESLVFVSDSDFMTDSEVYDDDNEVFVGNLLEFLVSGDKPDDVPEVPDEGESDF